MAQALGHNKIAPQAKMPPLYRQLRWWILALLFGVTALNFVDRQALAVLGSDITREFRLSNTAFGAIGSGFRAGMMTGGFRMGWLMERAGARAGLTFAAGLVWFGNALDATAT